MAALTACSQADVLTGTLTEKASLSSPDGNLNMKFCISEKGEPVYSLNFGDK